MKKQMKKMLAIAMLIGLNGITNASQPVICENWDTKQAIVLPPGSYCPFGWRKLS